MTPMAGATAAPMTPMAEVLVHMEIVEVEAAPAVIRSAAATPRVVVGMRIRAAAAAVDMLGQKRATAQHQAILKAACTSSLRPRTLVA
jgi:hypothetical protein